MASLRAAFGERLERLARGGVVHSFTGTVEEMEELMGLGLYVGLNGCSFKTAENCEVVRAVRLDRLMIETDGPWCEVRPSHEGWKYLVEMEKKEKEAATAEAEAAAAAAADAQAQAAAETVVEGTTTEPPAQPQPAVTENPKENGSATGRHTTQKRAKPQQQPPQKSSKKPQKKEPEVAERFKTVKKEKWVDGAMVKGRNEPCTIERVAKIVAAIKAVTVEEVCEAAWSNTVKVFGVDEA